jgi:uncharacterized protein YbjQ (UPF0145 family)
MIKNICKDCLTIIWLTVLIILGACGHTTDANLTGVSIITGIERQPSDWEKVKIYLKSPITIPVTRYHSKSGTLIEVDEGEEDLASFSQLPESHEYIGYVEGIKQFKAPKDQEYTYVEIVNLRKESRSHALKLIKQNAARMGADGVVLTCIIYEKGYSGSDYGMCVIGGWAVHVPVDDFPSNNAQINNDKKEKCGEFQIYIDPPQQYEILGKVSSSQVYEYFDTWTTPTSAMKEGLKDLEKKVIKMGGNGLYIKSIVRGGKVNEFSVLFDALFEIYVEDPIEKKLDPEGYKRRHSIGAMLFGRHDSSDEFTWIYSDRCYLISGYAIKVPCGDEIIPLPFQNIYKDDPDHHLFPYKVTELYFPRYMGEVAVLAGEEPEEGSLYILHLTARTNKLNKEEILYWMRECAAEYGADTIILDGHNPNVYSGFLYWTARAFRTKNMEKTQ